MDVFLARRELLVGGLAAGAFALPVVTAPQARNAVDPRTFGARGDASSDDTLAVKEALSYAFDRGLPVDGGVARFAVRGNVEISKRIRPWIQALRLKQLTPSNDRKTLFFSDCDEIRIDRLEIDLGDSAARGYFNESGGLWIDGGSNHEVRNVEVFGHGKNSLIAIWNTRRGSYSNLRARDARYDDPDAKDDVVQGIFLCRNEDCVVQSPLVSNFSGNARPRFPTRFTRGIVGCGNNRLSLIDAQITNVDQGIDLTKSDGNRDCSVHRAHCAQCCSVGVKLANSAVGCTISDSVAERCGLTGFLASGPAAAGLRYKTQDCDFIRCVSYDAGYNSFADSAPHAGFRVERNRYDGQFPMDVRFIECVAIDRQTQHTMAYGFYEDVDTTAGTWQPNQLVDCRSVGHLKAMSYGTWK